MAPPIAPRRTPKTVCVVDVSSPLGGAIVDRLLHLGYSVHAASFSRGDSSTAAWRESKRVRVFAADPLDYHSIAAAIRGCSGVFYTYDNESFYDLWHALAKTLSEKTAWALAMDRGIDMISVNAGLILAGADLRSSPYLKGAPEMYEGGVLVTAKLEFLVDAHICVFESADAYGRYLCFNHTVCRPQDAVDFARLLSPTTPNPPPSAGLSVIQERIHSKKLTKLMFEFGAGLQAAE
ncbi:hypothetical protein KSP39_PZI022644 [Platanthera zijinensis]|uniref:Uncharacterized protein n=1 Tax=Platanthera zijinensis TaxID=2320716 RepID=A0AAP0AUW1_9ASPA